MMSSLPRRSSWAAIPACSAIGRSPVSHGWFSLSNLPCYLTFRKEMRQNIARRRITDPRCMMAGTTVRSRRLAGILKEYRKASGLRQPEVAAYVGRISVGVARTETAATCRPSVGDVRALLVLYGVTSPAEIEQVVDLARQVRETGWWHDYGLSDTHRSFVALESEAAGKRVWSDMFIPGLLQTEGYARAVITAGPDTLDDARVD